METGMIDATFVNIADNVPYSRIYKTRGRFVSAFKRLKGAVFLHAIDKEKMEFITLDDMLRSIEGTIKE